MTTTKPMTGEQLDELMAVAVRMQRDAEVDCNYPSANFAYAVQVAVLELHRTRDVSVALVAENATLKSAIQTHSESVHFCELCGKDDPCSTDDVCMALSETPDTDAYMAEVRAQAHKEGAHFVANRMLAAWEAGFIEDTAKNAADIARMILTSTEFMPNAPEGDFDRSFADGVLEDIAAQLRQEAVQ